MAQVVAGLQPCLVLGRQRSLKEINFLSNDISNSLSAMYKFLFAHRESTLVLERPLSKRWVLDILVCCYDFKANNPSSAPEPIMVMVS